MIGIGQETCKGEAIREGLRDGAKRWGFATMGSLAYHGWSSISQRWKRGMRGAMLEGEKKTSEGDGYSCLCRSFWPGARGQFESCRGYKNPRLRKGLKASFQKELECKVQYVQALVGSEQHARLSLSRLSISLRGAPNSSRPSYGQWTAKWAREDAG